jgi:hypothetical protein
MGASVVNEALTSANWAEAKPKDYKNADLDKALSAWEALAKKTGPDPALPAKPSIKGYESFAKDAKDLLAVLKEWDTGLGAVSAAASKCEAELRKMSDKLEGDARVAYFNAAGSAGAIGGKASAMKAKLV